MECAYCDTEINKTQGKMLVRNSGKKVYFCSGKCEKNWARDRNLDYADQGE
ncbi:MAG: 50S ribosomal protein L24e [Candidatus Nanohaloarchaea archaeon]|nr:50S ribosomal protein L24e [Candidatus Nanohaloarchaea archaeon]